MTNHLAVLGEYQVGKTIGQGAFSKVKIGIHKETGQKVAIKIIDKKQIAAKARKARDAQQQRLERKRAQVDRSRVEKAEQQQALRRANTITSNRHSPPSAGGAPVATAARRPGTPTARDTEVQRTTDVVPAAPTLPVRSQDAEIEPGSQLGQLQPEVQLLMRLDHPNIIKLYQVMETDDECYIIMEYASGGELIDYIAARDRLTEPEARRYFRQIISALDHCHCANVVHRDLKLENLLLNDKREILITDFGLGRTFHNDVDEYMSTFCGTPNYAAVELISGIPYIGVKSDVWAMGVVLYIMTTGRPPFNGETISALYSKIKAVDYRCPEYFSRGLRNLLAKILVKDPNERATMQLLREDPWVNFEYVERPIHIDPKITGLTGDSAQLIKGIMYDKKYVIYTIRRHEKYSRNIQKRASISSKSVKDHIAKRKSISFKGSSVAAAMSAASTAAAPNATQQTTGAVGQLPIHVAPVTEEDDEKDGLSALPDLPRKVSNTNGVLSNDDSCPLEDEKGDQQPPLSSRHEQESSLPSISERTRHALENGSNGGAKTIAAMPRARGRSHSVQPDSSFFNMVLSRRQTQDGASPQPATPEPTLAAAQPISSTTTNGTTTAQPGMTQRRGSRSSSPATGISRTSSVLRRMSMVSPTTAAPVTTFPEVGAGSRVLTATATAPQSQHQQLPAAVIALASSQQQQVASSSGPIGRRTSVQLSSGRPIVEEIERPTVLLQNRKGRHVQSISSINTTLSAASSSAANGGPATTTPPAAGHSGHVASSSGTVASSTVTARAHIVSPLDDQDPWTTTSSVQSPMYNQKKGGDDGNSNAVVPNAAQNTASGVLSDEDDDVATDLLVGGIMDTTSSKNVNMENGDCDDGDVDDSPPQQRRRDVGYNKFDIVLDDDANDINNSQPSVEDAEPSVQEIQDWHEFHRPPKTVRTVRFSFNSSTSSTESPVIIFQELHRVLLEFAEKFGGRFLFQRIPDLYLVNCRLSSGNPEEEVEFEVEVCKIWMLKLHGVRIKRLSGNPFAFKKLYGDFVKCLQL